MYYWPAPTIYEQNYSEFMNKIVIYFIVVNGLRFVPYPLSHGKYVFLLLYIYTKQT